MLGATSLTIIAAFFLAELSDERALAGVRSKCPELGAEAPLPLPDCDATRSNHRLWALARAAATLPPL